MRASLFTSVFLSASLLVAAAIAEEGRLVEETLPALPEAVSNNAVALLVGDDGVHLYSMLGLRSGKTWQDTSSEAAHYFSVKGGANGTWQNIEPVPGGKGRLAASAKSAGSPLSLTRVFHATGWLRVMMVRIVFSLPADLLTRTTSTGSVTTKYPRSRKQL